ncbi:MAG: hypothetical protein D6736_11220 [Nitrospinota bacterium]|nr:MAG: hypothetical protein D6736_11220 [Nitrospinota bacterium]
MKGYSMPSPNVVLLVDNKKRDLLVAALIAHHLEEMGVRCHLEPLHAYRAVLGAYKPDLIVFNHLTASHLVAYSRRLAQLGVLTAVLPNEGILYNRDVLRYNAGKHHRGAHIDYFFCWNRAHKEALSETGFASKTHIEVVGVPRFDFYFAPWSRIFQEVPAQRSSRPNVLVCTNFVFARFHDLPPSRADRFFAPWKDRIPAYGNYWELIESRYRARKRFFAFLEAIVHAGRFTVTLRPHPSEDASVYREWYQQLSPALQQGVTIDQESNITRLILACDLEISCETCTTALESWIAHKPTIELVFDRHPVFFHPEVAALNVLCDDPAEIVSLIESQLAAPEQKTFAEARQRHLATWCNGPDGRSAWRIARTIAQALQKKRDGEWRGLQWSDYRRGLKLKGLRSLGLPYNYDPLLFLKKRLFPRKYASRVFVDEKTIRPRDVVQARALLQQSINEEGKE